MMLAGASGGSTSTKIFSESFLDLEVGAAASNTFNKAIMYCGRLGRRVLYTCSVGPLLSGSVTCREAIIIF